MGTLKRSDSLIHLPTDRQTNRQNFHQSLGMHFRGSRVSAYPLPGGMLVNSRNWCTHQPNRVSPRPAKRAPAVAGFRGHKLNCAQQRISRQLGRFVLLAAQFCGSYCWSCCWWWWIDPQSDRCRRLKGKLSLEMVGGKEPR